MLLLLRRPLLLRRSRQISCQRPPRQMLGKPRRPLRHKPHSRNHQRSLGLHPRHPPHHPHPQSLHAPARQTQRMPNSTLGLRRQRRQRRPPRVRPGHVLQYGLLPSRRQHHPMVHHRSRPLYHRRVTRNPPPAIPLLHRHHAALHDRRQRVGRRQSPPPHQLHPTRTPALGREFPPRSLVDSAYVCV